MRQTQQEQQPTLDFCVIIPARYASTRLPKKMLADIQGQPLIQYTYERAKSSGASRVIIATDHPQIKAICESFNAEVYMTEPAHSTGTDRVAEAARLAKLAPDQIVINLQGDEPGMPAELIRQLAHSLANKQECNMATVCVPITSVAELFNPHVVKVVLANNQEALYFSRAPIPWDREAFSSPSQTLRAEDNYWRHLGLYAFRQSFLQQFVSWPKTSIENIELLEQLRALYYGVRIHVLTDKQQPPVGIDTQEDLDHFRLCLSTL